MSLSDRLVEAYLPTDLPHAIHIACSWDSKTYMRSSYVRTVLSHTVLDECLNLARHLRPGTRLMLQAYGGTRWDYLVTGEE